MNEDPRVRRFRPGAIETRAQEENLLALGQPETLSVADSQDRMATEQRLE